MGTFYISHDTRDCHIVDCVSLDAVGCGVRFHGGENNSVQGTTVQNSTEYPIYLRTGSHVAEGCYVRECSHPVLIYEGSDILNCDVEGTFIVITGANAFRCVGNKVFNSSWGIRIDSCQGPGLIENNLCYNNSDGDIVIHNSSNLIVRGNVLKSATAIRMSSSAKNIVIEDNDIVGTIIENDPDIR